jgi:hypothetical protein
MSTNAATMETERAAKVAVERAKIEAADKVKIAKANKEAKAEREREQKEAAKPAAKKKNGGDHPRMTDAELAGFVKKFAAPGMTRRGVVKAFRAAGPSAAGHRIRDVFDEVTKGRSKTNKK